jgi:hypothetical protein
VAPWESRRMSRPRGACSRMVLRGSSASASARGADVRLAVHSLRIAQRVRRRDRDAIRLEGRPRRTTRSPTHSPWPSRHARRRIPGHEASPQFGQKTRERLHDALGPRATGLSVRSADRNQCRHIVCFFSDRPRPPLPLLPASPRHKPLHSWRPKTSPVDLRQCLQIYRRDGRCMKGQL